MLLFGGIPYIYYDRFMELAIRQLRDCEFTGLGLLPIRGGYSITEEYCDELLETLVRFAEHRPECLSDGLGVLLLKRPWEHQEFEHRFSPFAFCVSAKIDAALREQGEGRKRAANEYAGASIRLGGKILRRQQEITRFLSDQLRRTPAMLPVRSFRSNYLQDFLRTVCEGLKGGEPVASVVEKELASFLNAHPRRRDGKGFIFEDDAGVYFKSPPRNLFHGSRPLRPNENGHNNNCFLTSRLRLGGYYLDGFHYDCTRKGRQLAAELENCHDERRSYTGRPNLNIYPNDFIRS
jgi:hypothetical protein